MSRADRLAILLSLLAVAAAYLVADRIFERIPHLEDEVAYAWQARLMTTGQVVIESPPAPKSFLVPFVVDYQGRRFGKYPLGWPAVLAVGDFFGLRDWVNPLLAGLAVWLTYRLGKKLFGEIVGLFAALLTLTSPFFLLNAGSLLSHVWGLVLTLAFTLAWLDAFVPYFRPQATLRRRWFYSLAAAAFMGMLALSRPLTAVAVALPFAIHGVILLWRGSWEVRQRLLGFGLLAGAITALHFAWQFAATGDPWLNLYTLWWEYDKVGFGPGFGVRESGHSLRQAWINTRFSLLVGSIDLFGWLRYSWIFLPFGLWALVRRHRRNGSAWLAVGVIFALVLVYLAYWVGSWLFGPRYYLEGLLSLVLLTALGAAYLAGLPLACGEAYQPWGGWARLRRLGVTGLLFFLVGMNLVFFLPGRLNMMVDLYTINRAWMEPFQTADAQALTPALVIVHAERWMPYGALLELQDPQMTTPFIFAFSRGYDQDQTLAEYFPERRIVHYYEDMPGQFYDEPIPDFP